MLNGKTSKKENNEKNWRGTEAWKERKQTANAQRGRQVWYMPETFAPAGQRGALGAVPVHVR